jgi:hypothetical protein
MLSKSTGNDEETKLQPQCQGQETLIPSSAQPNEEVCLTEISIVHDLSPSGPACQPGSGRDDPTPESGSESGPGLGSAGISMAPHHASDRKLKLIMFLCGFVALGVLASFAKDLTFPELILALLSIGCAIFFGMWAFVLLTSKHLYRVRVHHVRITEPSWLPFAVPTAHTKCHRQPVFSVSELAAVRVTILNELMHAVSAFISITAFIFMCSAWQNIPHIRPFRAGSGTETTLLFGMATCIGFPLLTVFELSPVDAFFRTAHMVGVFLMLIGTFAFPVVVGWTTLSIVLLVSEYIVASIWMIFMYKLPQESDDIKVVSRVSYMCVWTELLMFFLNAMIVILTVESFNA